jgi:hypothetical protein
MKIQKRYEEKSLLLRMKIGRRQELSGLIKWDTARRSYVIFTGKFKRAWTIRYIIDKIKSAVENSEACATCRCDFPLDAMHPNTFFLYVTIDAKEKQDIEACDSHVFSELFRELESMGIKHRISNLSYPEGNLRIAYITLYS